MPFTVQNDQGTATDANAYISVAELDSYWQDRGVDLSGSTTAEKEQAIVKATDFIDGMGQFIGRRQQSYQDTQWPRLDAWDHDSYLVSGIPKAIKKACAEMARRALAGDILPDPEQEPSGARVEEYTEKVGPLEETRKYAAAGAYQQPIYPMVLNILTAAGLLVSGRRLMRA